MATKTANAMFVLKRYSISYRTSGYQHHGFHPALFSQTLFCYRSTGIPPNYSSCSVRVFIICCFCSRQSVAEFDVFLTVHHTVDLFQLPT